MSHSDLVTHDDYYTRATVLMDGLQAGHVMLRCALSSGNQPSENTLISFSGLLSLAGEYAEELFSKAYDLQKGGRP